LEGQREYDLLVMDRLFAADDLDSRFGIFIGRRFLLLFGCGFLIKNCFLYSGKSMAADLF
jgi:hypothetical protein